MTSVVASISCGVIALLMTGLSSSILADETTAGEQEIQAAMREYARLQVMKDAAGLAAFYTPDGELLEPGMSGLKGPVSIRRFLESFPDIRIESASMLTEQIYVWGTDALQWGSYAQRAALPGKPVEEFRGRFVAQWTRQAGGRWLIRRLLTQPS